MADNDNRSTRSELHRSKKKGSGWLTLILSGIALGLVFYLVFQFFYGGEDTSETAQSSSSQSEQSSLVVNDSSSESSSEASSASSSSEESSSSESEAEESESEEEESSENEEEVSEVPSDDPNVARSYTGNWEPIGTTQSGEHVTNYDDGSADRVEIKRAVSQVLDIPEGNLIENWIGNDGNQKVTATVTNTDDGKSYRVYLSWIDGQGWQPTLVEELAS